MAPLLIETFESERDRGRSLSVLADFSKDLSLFLSLFVRLSFYFTAERGSERRERERERERESDDDSRYLVFCVSRAMRLIRLVLPLSLSSLKTFGPGDLTDSLLFSFSLSSFIHFNARIKNSTRTRSRLEMRPCFTRLPL